MKRLLAALLVLVAPPVFSAGADVALSHPNIDLGDRASLQRGAKLFVNYCLSCHAASYMRYNRMGRDLGLTDEQVRDNLMFAADKVGETMTVAMSPSDGEAWFGKAPPDLTVISRYRGADWLYSYLLAFYEDRNPSRPFAVNNLVFKDVAMPHVLSGLQGTQVLKERSGGDAGHGAATPRIADLLELETPGSMTPVQYRRAMEDLVNFLVYMGEPAKLVRYRVGTWVLIFLVVLFFLTRGLYKAYWKDVH